MEKVIWHYTNFIALNGILVEGTLHLCNTKGMNDKREMDSFITGIEKAILYRYPERKKEIYKVFNKQRKKRENENVYGSSFSILKNDAAQWERYGFAGKGVSIGFKRELFEQIIGKYLLEPVSYRKDFRNHDFVEIIPPRIWDKKFDDHPYGDRDKVFRNLWACSGAYKDISFKSEKEIRLMTLPISPTSPFLPEYGEIEYEVTTNKIREYINFDIQGRCEQKGIEFEKLITEIIVGPKSTQSEIILKNFFKKNNLPILANKVKKSDCPLR